MGPGNEDMRIAIANLPSAVQTQLKSIHDEYEAKQDALRTEEKTKIDNILASYPEVKAKFDTMKVNHPEGMDGRGFGRNHEKNEQ